VRRGGPTSWSKVSLASTRWKTSPPAQFAPARVTNTPPQTNLAPNNTRRAREGAQRGTCRSGTPCLSAPFGKPRPLAESLQNTLSSHQYLMPQCRAFTIIRLSQKRANYAHKMHSLSRKVAKWQSCQVTKLTASQVVRLDVLLVCGLAGQRVQACPAGCLWPHPQS